MKTSSALRFLFILLLAGIGTATGYTQQKAGPATTLKSSGYAPVNGIKMYYEVHGEGKPLVLLHGSYMTIGLNWSELIPELAKNRQVIALEMQGHGHTADTDRPVSYDNLADDVAGLLKHLKIDKADILGYSLGGTVAFQFTIRHPQMVNKLVVLSSVYKSDGWMPEVLKVFRSFTPEFVEQTPLKTSYDSVAPDPKHWRAFMNKYIAFDQKDFDLGEANIKAIKAPVLLVMGDNDGVALEHKVKMYQLCGGGVFGDMQGLPRSQLAIVPGTTHVSLMTETKKLTVIIPAFLDNESAPPQR